MVIAKRWKVVSGGLSLTVALGGGAAWANAEDVTVEPDETTIPTLADVVQDKLTETTVVTVAGEDVRVKMPGESPLDPLTVTVSPVEESPVTVSPVEESPLTVSPVEESPLTVSPVEESPVTASPVTVSPVEESPATASPASPATQSPTTPATATPDTASPDTSDD